MGNRQKIMNACKKSDAEIVALTFNRAAQPTPDQFALGGQWELVARVDGEELVFVGDADDIIEGIRR